VSPPKSRAWNDVLDNLGENLIRLGTSLSVLSETPSAATHDAAFIQSMGQIATGFRLAFRQARPALAAGEPGFREAIHSTVPSPAPASGGHSVDPAGRAETLVHEGILVCQDMVTLLNLIEQGSGTDPDRTRQTFVPALRRLAETTAAAGWELRTICHEYESEVHLSESLGTERKGAPPVSLGLLYDLAGAAQSLRLARREWFRAGQRLATILGTEAPRAAAVGEPS
jgi:hypothetical protein